MTHVILEELTNSKPLLAVATEWQEFRKLLQTNLVIFREMDWDGNELTVVPR